MTLILLATLLALALAVADVEPSSFSVTTAQSDGDGDDGSEMADVCAKIAEQSKDDGCITVNPDNGCDINIDVGCQIQRLCMEKIAALNDPCIHYSHYDVNKRRCQVVRDADCAAEVAASTSRSLAAAESTRALITRLANALAFWHHQQPAK